MTFRKNIFWVHLVAGLLAGGIILIMSFTGAVLAFEKEIVAWVDREATRVAVPATGAPRLTVEEMVQRAQDAQPGSRVGSLMVKADPAAAVALTLGTATVYLNPYTGEIRPQGAVRTRAFMRSMTAWHRTLAMSGEQRTTGKAITGAGNIVFLALAVTGLYIWMPRQWSWRVLRPSVWFTAARGKARDWNWHNVIGLWSTPVLIVLTLTALPISYAWVSALINRLNGPVAAMATPAAAVTVPLPEGLSRQPFQALLAAAQAEVPDWKQITLRFDGGAAGRRGGRGAAAEETAAAALAPAAAAGGAPRNAAAPVSFTIREAHSWPRTANITVALNPFTGQVLTRSGYAQLATGAQVRAWTRFLHTGEALGPAGQLVAGLACLGACVLVHTGFALSWRRFLGRRKTPVGSAVAKEPSALASVPRP
jgi:uncharacterized iron-regulated membrane protein